MITLRNFKPILGAFDARELLQPAMVDFDLPGIKRIKGGLINYPAASSGVLKQRKLAVLM
jgi:hypothetical protein